MQYIREPKRRKVYLHYTTLARCAHHQSFRNIEAARAHLKVHGANYYEWSIMQPPASANGYYSSADEGALIEHNSIYWYNTFAQRDVEKLQIEYGGEKYLIRFQFGYAELTTDDPRHYHTYGRSYPVLATARQSTVGYWSYSNSNRLFGSIRQAIYCLLNSIQREREQARIAAEQADHDELVRIAAANGARHAYVGSSVREEVGGGWWFCKTDTSGQYTGIGPYETAEVAYLALCEYWFGRIPRTFAPCYPMAVGLEGMCEI